jgi:tetratricopeptide (TPR) repeat protein
MRDVQLASQAFHTLYQNGELRSATERLRDAWMIGEYMPELRTIPLQRKRDILGFLQKTQQLESSLETRNFTLAQELLTGTGGLKEVAKDFDSVEAQSLIDAAKAAARLHLEKAHASANSGNHAGFDISIQEAAKIWPTNPELTEVSQAAFKMSDTAHQSLLELDQLIAHKNFSRIGREAGRFLAAAQTATPERRARLLEILDQVASINTSLAKAQEYSRKGDYPGAWESLDKAAKLFPDELEINKLRSELTTKAPVFVSAIETARRSEDSAQPAVSLSWYLKAQRIYPASEIAQDAQSRIAPQLLKTP